LLALTVVVERIFGILQCQQHFARLSCCHEQVDRMEVDMGNAQDKRVVVIVAGIVGASLAYHPADKGANHLG
jgi:hypothetical protein